MLLSVPLRGSDGTVYGICGLEINSLLYRLTHRLPQHEAKGLLGVLALKNETSGGALLRVGSGFTSGTNAGQFKTPVDFAVSTGTNFNRYTGGDLDYVGLDRPLHLAPISLPGQSGTWVVAALTPLLPEALRHHRMLFPALPRHLLRRIPCPRAQVYLAPAARHTARPRRRRHGQHQCQGN